MRDIGQRVILTGLAVAPALATTLVPLSEPGGPAALAIGGACSTCALVSAMRAPGPATARAGRSLLRRSAFRRVLPDLPTLTERRRRVAEALNPPPPEAPDAPPGEAEAIAAALAQVLAKRAQSAAEALDDDTATELYLLAELLRAPPDRAGTLAQAFRRPDSVLDMRDQVMRLRARREAFDRQRNAFEATALAWQRQDAQEPGLLQALKTLGAPDPDLWHRVVLDHDRTDPEQRAAALWCVQQPDCDRATVALFLSHLAAADRLPAAARSGDAAFLAAILGIIEGWNAGAYRLQDLALDPPDAIAGDGALFAQTLGALAELLDAPRWPDPCGAFVAYRGRPPRRRAAWCLRSGRLVAPPDPLDYAFRDSVPA